ncbi:hypothetical protein AB0D42_27715 [Streptomyces sp. NPDC048304]|uniref:hypothetical protein n=1 Tax=Streptomyces sp. NPDC048304 TaxID=3154820 RepID=UPI0033C9BFA0
MFSSSNPAGSRARNELFVHLPDSLWLSKRDSMLDALETEVEQRVRQQVAADFEAALLKTTDGDDVHDDFAIPAGEVRRIIAELLDGGAR